MKFAHILGMTATLLIGSSAHADGVLFPSSDSGLVTIPAGGSAQINVVNLDPVSTHSCKVSLSVIDAAGLSVPLVPIVETISSGEAVGVPISPVSGLVRAHIDFSLQLIDASTKDPLIGCYNLIPTLEVFDAAGHHEAVITAFTGLPKLSKLPSKVTICHNGHTITINVTGLNGHFHSNGKAHKDDHLGACS